jgi:uncharacterized repeat protein (TIGR01451 family)
MMESKFFRGSLTVRMNLVFTFSLLFLLGLTPIPYVQAGVSFNLSGKFSTGLLSPSNVVVGDLNRDGILDLVITDCWNNSISILLGDGDGSFGSATNFTVGDEPVDALIADFNGDGIVDLAVVNWTFRFPLPPGTVSILLGTGIGSFGPAKNFEVGNGPLSLASGDFNRDGILDIVTVNGSNNNVSILLGDGAGGFGPATNFGVGVHPGSVGIGDLNGDGKLDLVVANIDDGTVSILLGTGTGSFGPSTDFVVGPYPKFVAVEDLNRDGKLDLVVANDGTDRITVLLGDGSGSFGAGTTYAVGEFPISVKISDLNGDGKLDLIVERYCNGGIGEDAVTVLLGDGTGSFGPTATVFSFKGFGGISGAVADLNGDGKPDLAVTDSDSGGVSILINTTIFSTSGVFNPHVDFATADGAASVAIADLNGDGKPDLVTANVRANSVSVLLGDGTGNFGTKTDFATGRNPGSVTIGDFNRDGKLDIATANYNASTVSVLLGDGAGAFSQKTDFVAGTGSVAIATSDLNMDGKLDFATANLIGTVSILLGDGNGAFGPKTDLTAGTTPRSIAIGDFNIDGKPDLVVGNRDTNNVSAFLGDGTGNFSPKTDFAAGNGPAGIAIADFNLDGKLDVAIANQGANTLSILLGDGTGSFSPKSDFTTGGGPFSVATGDLNMDGKPDIVVANLNDNTISILLGDGTGSFAAKMDYQVGAVPESAAIDDLNLDGKQDLVVANIGSNTVSILLNTPPSADLSIIKSDSPDPVAIGTNLTYVITVTNNGPDAAAGVIVTDTLPSNVTFVSATASQGSCSHAGGIVTCGIGDMSNGATVSINIVVTAPNSPGTITNSATVSSTNDPNDTNNSSWSGTLVVNIPDKTPPTPNPMAWAEPPHQTGTNSISMVASTATDSTPPISYYFDFVGSPTGGLGGKDSGWQPGTSYTNSNLQTNHKYGYRVKARDGLNNQTAYSTTQYDYTAIRAPTGITFGTTTSTTIQARSTDTPTGLSRGSSGLWIENMTNTTNSGWKRDNTLWTSKLLSPNKSYSFQAKARNGTGIETGYGPSASKYTRANLPGRASFSDVTRTSIRANWTANGNPDGTQYFCQNVTTGANSGWITETSWNSDNLACSISYSFRVKARNGDGVETAWTSLGSQSTVKCILLLKPNGGEMIPSGSTYDIQWEATPLAESFNLFYSLDSGVSWISIAKGVRNTIYPWPVPKTVGNKKACLIKVIGYTAFGKVVGSDKSDKFFAIEVVKVIQPNGGEILKSGNLYELKWEINGTKSPVTALKLYYTMDGGANWVLLNTYDANATSCSWPVPTPTTNKRSCYVRVAAYSGNIIVGSDSSDKPFTIEVVKVIQPNGGETLKSGNLYTIKWEVNGTKYPVAKIKVDYSRDGGSNWISITTLDGSKTSYDWIPELKKTKAICKVMVVLKDAKGNILGRDTSDGFFIIQPLPTPNLAYTGSEDYIDGYGNEYTRYNLEVTNSKDFSDELFAPAPYLPPCGFNPNASRTWVEIYDNKHNYIYGFCALPSSDYLKSLWFGLPKGTLPPTSVYIKMIDRLYNITYTSNLVTINYLY